MRWIVHREKPCRCGPGNRRGDGLAAWPLTELLRVEPTPGISDSVHHIYLADGAESIGPPEDDFESDHVNWIALAEVPDLISRGEISTGTPLAALLYALTRPALQG